jgi:hypothetical protein
MIDYSPIEYVTYQVYRRNTGEYVLVFYREDFALCRYKCSLTVDTLREVKEAIQNKEDISNNPKVEFSMKHTNEPLPGTLISETGVTIDGFYTLEGGNLEFKNLERIEYGRGDAVKCNNCEWAGIVSVGEDGCPYCGYKGCLSDIEQDVLYEGNVYVPEN